MTLPWQTPKTGPQKPGRFVFSLPWLSVLFKWLVNLVTTTPEDRERAGIYLNGQGRN